MKTLIIKDLAVAAELDTKAMSAVRGGSYGGWKMPAHMLSMPGHEYPSYAGYSSTTTVSLDQVNNQLQSNATGNGSAVFGGSISACNNQQGFNSIG